MIAAELPITPTKVANALDDYGPVIGQEEVDAIHAMARPLEGRSVQMVNSTLVGGGVAEILNRIVPLMKELSINVRWDVMTGSLPFFAVTKAFHNALHGATYPDRPQDFDVFMEATNQNLGKLPHDSEFTVIHDPQPAGMILARPEGDNHWIWRCHIDLSHPNQTVWNFLEQFVSKYDGAIFSSPAFARRLSIPQYLFYPAIDPLAEKNRELEPEYIAGVLERYGIDSARPIVTQISRFDRLKDPVGVVRAFRLVKRFLDCQLVLAGGSADDDPEGSVVLAEVKEVAGDDPDIHLLELPPAAPLEVNALQRASTVIVQKSLREGFGLTVAEALWKKKPVVASAVGGIPVQVIHKQTGLLAHSVEGTAYQIRYLLTHPAIATRLGEQGHQHVREELLITGNLQRYLTLFIHRLRTGRG